MTPDPLRYHTPLPYRRTFYPLGFGATIATNCETVIAAAESIWGKFRKMRNEPPVELRLAVSESRTGEKPAPRMPRGQGHLISFIHDADNFVVCDLRAGYAFGWITTPVASEETYVRYYFVESCIYLMLDALYLTTVHAACIDLHGKGILLSGDCGAGKSTLSYQCAKRGWAFVSDDASHIIRASDGRVVVGNPYQVRFRPHAMTVFPELTGNVPFERPNGKPSIELDTASLNLAIKEQTHADYLIFLKRNPAAPQQLRSYDKEEAFVRLSQVICFGDESLREELRAGFHRLLTVPVYEMQYYDLDWAEQRLRSLVENNE